jgi:predicted Zn-dependent protease
MKRRSQIGMGYRTAAFAALCLGLAALAQGTSEGDFKTLLKQGFDLHQQARFAESIPLLEKARKLEPGDYFVNLLLGIDLLRTEKASEAVPRLETAARANHGEEIPEEYLGEAEASLSRYSEAAEAYRQAVLRGHGSVDSLEAWAGFALERFRQIGESLRASDAGVATARRLQQAAAKPAALLSCDGSISALEKGLAAKLEMDHAYRLSICYAVEAGKAAEQLQAKDEDPAALHRLRGDVLLRLKGDAAAAKAEYQQAIKARPNDPTILERMAEAQLAAGDADGARQSAQAALAIDPHQREALRTMASLAMNDRDYEKAIRWLRQLVAESPNDLAVQVELGKALAQTGNTAEALKYLAPALSSGYPDEKGALHATEAKVLRELGREEEGAKAAAEARRLSDAFQARNKEGGTSANQ